MSVLEVSIGIVRPSARLAEGIYGPWHSRLHKLLAGGGTLETERGARTRSLRAAKEEQRSDDGELLGRTLVPRSFIGEQRAARTRPF